MNITAIMMIKLILIFFKFFIKNIRNKLTIIRIHANIAL